MIEIREHVDVGSTADEIFATVADLRAYNRWLASSGSYAGTTEISEGQIALGTTYVETERRGTRHGTVTEFEPPRRITFHQPMTINPRSLGIVIDITVSYTLAPRDGAVSIDRVVSLGIPWPLRLAQPLVVRQFRGLLTVSWVMRLRPGGVGRALRG